ncbi:MAG: DNA polymerase I [Pseudohongiellaceae bacterium]
MAQPRNPLILIDGSSYLFRAFHALPPLNSSKDQPTGAIKGVISMIRRLKKDYPDSPVAVVFDAKGKTFRNELYEDYKAHRPPMPDDLRSQIAPIHDIVRAMGLPLLIIDEVEADDVIGTLAAQATADQRDVLVSTGDKDLAQLVSDHVTLLNTMTDEHLDRQGVEKKFGLPPEKIIDLLALTGDKSDNIPGVPGVGPKTAVKWLQEWDSVDGIIEHADQVKGKIGERLRENIEQLKLSRELVTIRLDVPLDLTLHELIPEPEDRERLLALFRELEFRGWSKELEQDGVSVPEEEQARVREAMGTEDHHAEAAQSLDVTDVTPDATDYRCITDGEALKECLARIRKAGRVAISAVQEGGHFMDRELIGLALAWAPGEAVYVPLAHDNLTAGSRPDRDALLAQLKPDLENPKIRKLAHDAKALTHVLQNVGITISEADFDTLLASYVLNSVASNHTLEAVARHYLDTGLPELGELIGSGRKKLAFRQLEPEQLLEHAARSADLIGRLGQLLDARLQESEALAGLFRYYEMRLSPVLQRMERCGVLLDADLLGRQSREIEEKLTTLERKAHEVAGEAFNLGSPKQLQAILYEKMEIPVIRKTPKGQPSTAEPVLQELALDHELPRIIMDHRGLSKLKSTYTDKLPLQINAHTGRVHTTLQQAVAATGRLSSTDPNLQNIPIRTPEGRKVRQAFIAAPGYRLVAADYSQVELRIMAHLSGDEGLRRAFAEGQDIHRATAAEVFDTTLDEVSGEQRRRAKAINFGLIYGMSAFGLARQLGIERRDAQQYVERYFERYPGVRDYMERTREEAGDRGYVETLFGRRLYLPDIRAANGMLRQAAQRTAINAPMQGSAADIIKQAMVDIDHWLRTDGGLDARMLLQVHDELIFEVAEKDIELLSEGVRFRMMSAASLAVPLVVDIGTGMNWDEAH